MFVWSCYYSHYYYYYVYLCYLNTKTIYYFHHNEKIKIDVLYYLQSSQN